MQEMHEIRHLKRTVVIFVLLLQIQLQFAFVFNNILRLSVGPSYSTHSLFRPQ